MSAMAAIEAEFLRVLSASAEVKAILGDPVRIVSGETARAAYPFIRIDRHEIRRSAAKETGPDEHFISLEIFTRSGGRTTAQDSVAVVRETLRGVARDLEGYRLVLLHPLYADVFLRQDGTTFRGVLRLKVLLDAEG